MSDAPVVFVPGLGADGRVYAPFLSHLARSRPVRSADPPLDLPQDLDWHFWTGIVDRAAQDFERFMLVGHSLGGAIALHYAARFPGRVVKTVAVAPVLFPLRHRPRSLAVKFRNGLLAFVSGHPVHFVKAANIMRRRMARGSRRPLLHWAGSVDLSPDLPRLSDAVILWPEKEEVIPRKQFDTVQRKYPKLRTSLVRGRHLDLVFAPAFQAKAIEEALDG